MISLESDLKNNFYYKAFSESKITPQSTFFRESDREYTQDAFYRPHMETCKT